MLLGCFIFEEKRTEADDPDGDGYGWARDCDNRAGSTFPGAAEKDSTSLCMRDADGDGFGDIDVEAPLEPGSDCDDSDPAVSPEAEEIPYNGADDDCDSDTPDDDLDRDGYGTAQDCDDDDHHSYPGAAEVWYDGTDQDCGGDNDYDADGDGWASAENPNANGIAGEDCDDQDPHVFPRAEEICRDGKVNDCSGSLAVSRALCEFPEERGLADADGKFIGEALEDKAGMSVAGIGDLNGDGFADLAVGAHGNDGEVSNSGAAYVLLGPPAGGPTLADAGFKIRGEEEQALLGWAVAGMGGPGEPS